MVTSPPGRDPPSAPRRQGRCGLQFGGGLLPGGMPPRAWLALLVALLGSRAALAVQLEALEAGREGRGSAPLFPRDPPPPPGRPPPPPAARPRPRVPPPGAGGPGP